MTFPMVPHMHGLWGKRATNTHVYFQLYLPFFKNVKELVRNFDIWTIQKYQNPKIEFYVIFHDANTSGVDYAETCVGRHSSL